MRRHDEGVGGVDEGVGGVGNAQRVALIVSNVQGRWLQHDGGALYEFWHGVVVQ